jgi:ABC-type branched-subunit amino acid transport system substrate-binding protein
MSNSPEQPTGTDGPLRYAPRRTRDDPRQWRAPSAIPSTKSVDSHGDAEPEGDNVFRDRPFPLREMSLPPTPPVPPPSPVPTRGRFVALRGLAIFSLVAIVSSSLAALVYPSIFSRQPDATRVNPPAPQVGVNEPLGPAKFDERASLSPTAASVPVPTAAVATQRAARPVVRGVTDTEIRFGMAAPFSGSARELGRQMKLGIDTAFGVVNAAGGAHGRQLKLIAADDGYEPTRTAEVMKQLYEKDQVFGIVGNVGTPTATVAVPYALEQRMLFFGAFTGAGLLRRDPPDRYVFNYRASYAEETDAVVRYLVKIRRVRPDQIAVFAQQDGYGDAGFAGVAKAIRALQGGIGDANILRLNYKRNTVDVDEAVASLRLSKTPIKAVIMVPTYRAAARFIEKTRDLFPGMIYTNVSFVGSTALAQELMLLGSKYADGVIVTQVVPPVEGYSSLVLDYKAALAKYFPGEAPDYVSLEGYVAAGLLAEGLKRTGPEPDIEKLVETLENLRDLDIGVGTPVSFSRADHQGSHKIWGTQLDQAGRSQPIDLQ